MKKVGIVKVLFSEQSLAKCPKSTDLCDQARHYTSTNFPSTTTDSIYLSINYLTSTMSLSTLRSSPSPRTPRERIYGRAEQYFDITAPGAHSSSTQFLPSPITKEPTNNWSTEDEAAWDQRLAKGGSKKILTARKRMDIR
jgi:hypothetical protein